MGYLGCTQWLWREVASRSQRKFGRRFPASLVRIDVNELGNYAKVVWRQDRHRVERRQASHLNSDNVFHLPAGILPPKVARFRPCRYRPTQAR